jgi:carotenoid cleavage dioxygenase
MDFAANTHVIAHSGRTLATVEAGALPYELGTIGPCDFGGTLPGGFAAHTKLDHRTGELHAIAYFWAWDHVQHVVVDAAGKVIRTTDVAVPDGPMMHDFALTGRYVVLLDFPVTFSLDAVSAGKELPYVWNPDHQARSVPVRPVLRRLDTLVRARAGDAGPVGHRSGGRQGHPAAPGRSLAGVPPGR